MYYIISAKTGKVITHGMGLGIARKVAVSMLETGFAQPQDKLVKIQYHRGVAAPVRHFIKTLEEIRAEVK